MSSTKTGYQLALEKAWADWHSGVEPEDIPPVYPLFEHAFKAGFDEAVRVMELNGYYSSVSHYDDECDYYHDVLD